MRFRFTLTNTTLGAYILTKDPIGWDKMEILFKRSPKYHGVFYEKSIDLQFYCGGAGKEFIDQVLDEQGIDAEIKIKIEIACGCEGDTDSLDYSEDYSDDYGSEAIGNCTFEELYLGKLDLKSYRSLNGKVSLNIIQEGITQTVINRMDTVIDLTRTDTLDGTALAALAPYDLTMHSKELILNSIMGIDGTSTYSDSILDGPTYENVYIELPFEEITIDDMGGFIVPIAPFFKGVDTINNTEDIPQPLFVNDGLKTVNIDYSFIGSVALGLFTFDGSYDLYFVIAIGDSFTSNTPIYSHAYGASSSSTINISDTGTLSNITINDSKNLIAYIELRSANLSALPGGGTANFNFTQCSLSITWNSTTDLTTAKAFKINDVFNKVFSSISDQENAYVSDYFGSGCGEKRAITNGALIRNFPVSDTVDLDGKTIAGRPVKISANELFESFNAIDNLGMGIEKDGDDFKVRVDTKEYFYDDAVLFQLTNVPNIESTIGTEYFYSRLEFGYEKWETQFANGIDEFNSIRQYDTGIKSIDNPITALSKIISSGYVIEACRRKQFVDSSTEDFDFDNDNFVICLNQDDDTLAEKNENFTTVSNVISPETSYNLRISPSRNLLRWSNVINGGLLKYTGREIKFTSGTGNFKMGSEFTSDACPGRWNNNLFSEGQNIQWDHVDNTDNNPIWEPEIISFNYPLTRTQFNLLADNPNGVIEVSSTSENYVKYYILEARYKPVGGLTEFKLLKKWVS